MIIGQTLMADEENNRDYFTRWFPRVADNAVFTFQRIHSTLSVNEDVDVFEKNVEDAGTGTNTSGFSSQLGSTDLYEASGINLKEMVRFRVQLKAGTGWIHFRFLAPTWYPTGKV
jgi:hypothetical protein